jgi:hypothetical protein
MRGISGGTIPNDTDGWHYRINGYYHEIIKYFYGGWAFYFDYIFHDDGSLEIKVFTTGHNGEYKNFVLHYEPTVVKGLAKAIVDLDASAGSFGIATDTLLDMELFCSNNSILLNEADAALVNGLPPIPAIQAIANGSKLVFIGDTTDTFVVDGVAAAGPFICANPKSALSIQKVADKRFLVTAGSAA